MVSDFDNIFNDLDFGDNRTELDDCTKEFVNFIKSEKNDVNFAFVALTIGSPGSGKTALAFILFSLILSIDERWTVGFWRPPEGFLEIVKFYAPANIKDRFFVYYKLREVPNWTILIADEGAIQFNAKQALKKESVKMEMFLALTRQRNVIVIMNSQISNVMRSYRRSAQFKFYKQMTREDLREMVKIDPFIDDFAFEISRLDVKKTLFTSNWRKFNFEGYLYLDLKKWCPWYNDKISKAYEHQNADLDFVEIQRINPQIHQVAEMCLAQLGDLLMKPKGDRILHAWLRNQHPDVYIDFKPLLSEVYSECCLMFRTDPRFAPQPEEETERPTEPATINQALAQVDTQSNNPVSAESMSNFSESFSTFAKNQMTLHDLGEKTAQIAEVVRLFLENYPQKDIAAEVGISEGSVNKIWQEVRNKVIWKIFETWVSLRLGGTGKTAGNTNEPDFIDQYGNIFSIKWRYQGDKSLTFYQTQSGENGLVPEHDEAVKQHQPFFLVVANGRWKGDDMIKIIRINPEKDNDKIVVYRDDKSMQFEQFNKLLR